MDSIVEVEPFPERLRDGFSVAFTLLAAALYAYVLGSAVVRSFLEPAPEFTEGAVRIAGLLSGLVGSVVSAGFAKGKRPATASVSVEHPLGCRSRTSWQTLQRPSLLRCRLLGLSRLLGLRPLAATADPATGDETPVELDPGRGLTVNLWVALLYVALYFVVGAGAFVLVLTRPDTPEFLGNAAWVWLGTIVSSAYTYFGLGASMPEVVSSARRTAAARQA